MKEKIRPLYSELQGYLSQAPTARSPGDYSNDESLWLQYNQSVDLLSAISEQDYSRFRIAPVRDKYEDFVRINTYRKKLGGLISSLHGEYFADEPSPLSGSPSTIISQTQQQSQSIQMLLDIQSKIDENLSKYTDGSPERGFLEKFKSSLGSVSSVTDLFKLCFKLAKDFGISIATLLKIFGQTP